MAAKNGRCHLLELPSEIRLKIYNYAWDSYSPKKHDKTRPALLQTCSLICREATPALYISTRVLIVPLVNPTIFLKQNTRGEKYVDVAAVCANELASPQRVLDLAAKLPNLKFVIVWREWLVWFGPERIDFWKLMTKMARANTGSRRICWHRTTWTQENGINWEYKALSEDGDHSSGFFDSSDDDNEP